MSSDGFDVFSLRDRPPSGFYVYALVDELENRPFYFGKGKDLRWMYHEKSARKNCHINPTLSLRINEQIENNGRCAVFCIKDNLTEDQAFALERFLIENVFGLLNGVSGKRTEAQRKLEQAQAIPDVTIDDLFTMIDGVWCKAADYDEKVEQYISKRDALNEFAQIVNRQQLGDWIF